MRCSRGRDSVAFHASHDDHRFLIFSKSSFLRLVPHVSPTTISARLYVEEKPFDTSDRLLRQLVGEIPSKLTVRAKMVITDDERIVRSWSVRTYEGIIDIGCAGTVPVDSTGIQSCAEYFQDAHICAGSKLFLTSTLEVFRPTLKPPAHTIISHIRKYNSH
ncbi:hypothetical protein K443DRAFT_371809 [Laccaria amethystina LaAM-08-1]|uniref:Uncharacterized protein n=1 Tax=Laccaria amethystina LaAM-08-1 TaxID=1095629 RepID=A0A0C9X8T9_9AGAR|nr:hypothetical protein K443DRAFT_371809 [Laccaria amethystina LaAM-08-1]